MDLINKQVIHKNFGKGSVIEHTDSQIKIHFKLGNKKFIFPDAFGKYLTLIDQEADNLVKRMIQEKEKERKDVALEIKKAKDLQHEEQRRLLEREKLINNYKIHPSSQVVFWCEAQDQNTIFTDWKFFTGVSKSGYNEGKPNRLIRIHKNSACLLTVRDPGQPEKNRCILGVYMVNEAFIGKLCEDGYIPAHSKYRLRLSEQESEKMLFWNYYFNKRCPQNMTWNTGKYRYFDNVWTAQILRDIVSLKKKPQEREFVQDFFEYFCQMNQIGKEELPKPNGALTCT